MVINREKVRYIQKATPDYTFTNLIYVSEKCTGCGICEKVCPNHCITCKSGRTQISLLECKACMGCVQHCPNQAILFHRPEKNPDERYRNEHVSLQDIIEANENI